MGKTRVSSVIKEPCFGLLTLNDQWHQVRVLTCITEHGMVRNKVSCPDGTERTVPNADLKFSIKVRKFVPHPDFAKLMGKLKCVRVEYDLDYCGGNHEKVGDYAYVPHETIDRLTGKDMDKKLARAFEMLVGDPRHIVHYTFDETYDQDGNEWRDAE
jgi:hypothetical protein